MSKKIAAVSKVCPQCKDIFHKPKITHSRWEKRIYCSRGCRSQFLRPSLEEVWDRQTIPEPNSGCLLWIGANVQGYGYLTVNGKTILAHRLSYRMANGPFDEALDVLHRCDNPPCCEPNHLFLGTAHDNMQDCLNKGRHVSTPKIPKEMRPLIRASSELGKDIAERLGVSQSTISVIRTGRRQ